MTSLSPLPNATHTTPTLPAQPPAQPQGAADAAGASSFAGGDFETFLKMLTTQIKNQDPFNPMEGADFAVQLATFSGVEQQAKTNKLLELMATERAAGLGSVAAWIGKEVRTTAPVGYDGAPLRLDVRPAEGATSAQLVTLDQYGREAGREAISPSSGEVVWSGVGTDGQPLPNGRYSFKLVSFRGEDILQTSAVGAYSGVTGAELTSEGLRLTLRGGASALEREVTALRDPA